MLQQVLQQVLQLPSHPSFRLVPQPASLLPSLRRLQPEPLARLHRPLQHRFQQSALLILVWAPDRQLLHQPPDSIQWWLFRPHASQTPPPHLHRPLPSLPLQLQFPAARRPGLFYPRRLPRWLAASQPSPSSFAFSVGPQRRGFYNLYQLGKITTLPVVLRPCRAR